jgi:hypothetical protein
MELGQKTFKELENRIFFLRLVISDLKNKKQNTKTRGKLETKRKQLKELNSKLT